MIKINLLKAIRESSERPIEKKSQGGLFGGLFSQKSGSESSNPIESEGTSSSPLVMAIKILVMFGLAIGLFYYESVHIEELQVQYAEENAKLQSLKDYNSKAAASVAEIKKLMEDKIIIEKQIQSLDGLSKVRLKYVKVLDLIQSSLPEKMWFTELKSKESLLEASGFSFSENEITQFLNAVGKSVFFSDVSLVSSEEFSEKVNDKKKIRKFKINFLLEATK